MSRTSSIAATISTSVLLVLLAGVVVAQDDDVMSATDDDLAMGTEPVLAIANARLVDSGGTGDAIISAESPSAGAVEMRLTSVADDGTISIVAVDTIAIPQGGDVTLSPDGYHLALIDPEPALQAGDAIEISLVLEVAGPVTASAQIMSVDATTIAEASGGTTAAPSTPPAELPTSFTVEALDNFFVPNTLEAPAETEITVKLLNYGFLPHNIAFFTDDSATELLAETSLTAVIDPETEAVARFVTPGPGEYFILCVIHPEMTGTLIVR